MSDDNFFFFSSYVARNGRNIFFFSHLISIIFRYKVCMLFEWLFLIKKFNFLNKYLLNDKNFFLLLCESIMIWEIEFLRICVCLFNGWRSICPWEFCEWKFSWKNVFLSWFYSWSSHSHSQCSCNVIGARPIKMN